MKKILWIIFLGSFSCSGPDSKAIKSQAVETPDAVIPGEKGKCDGNRMPPANYQQETAYVSIAEPNASDLAAQKAVTRLRDKICQGYRCGVIEAKISLWHTARAATQVCAMAVIEAKDVSQFLEQPRAELEKSFEKGAAEIVKVVNAKSKKSSAKIAVGSVTDLGIEGSERSAWLVDKILASLGSAGADTVELPPNWSGLKTPKSVDGVVRGRVTKLHGQESMLEVTWRVQMKNSTRVFKGVEFPELVGPVTDLSTAMTEIDDVGDLSIRFSNKRSGGGMCSGDESDLIIESKTAIHTRIVNLFGDGSEGLLIHAGKKLKPNTAKQVAKVQVLRTTETPVERVVLFGAKREEDFGRFAKTPVPCRLPANIAKDLSSNRGYPEASKNYRTSTSYRILGKDTCGKSAEKQSVDLSSIPKCWE